MSGAAADCCSAGNRYARTLNTVGGAALPPITSAWRRRSLDEAVELAETVNRVFADLHEDERPVLELSARQHDPRHQPTARSCGAYGPPGPRSRPAPARAASAGRCMKAGDARESIASGVDDMRGTGLM